MPWASNADLPDTAKNYSEKCKSVFRRVANASLSKGDSEQRAIQNGHAAAKNCEDSD
jgi:uncharacterized protein YdaT